MQHDASFLQRRGVSPSSVKFHIVEPLCWLECANRGNFVSAATAGRSGSPSFKSTRLEQNVEQRTMGAVDEMVCHLTHTQPDGYVEEIRSLVFTPNAWRGRDEQGNSFHDSEFVSRCRLLQAAEVFLALRHAVHHEDIGSIKRLVGQLSVWFYGSSQPRYGFEMLYLQWLLTDSVSDPELQYAILGSGLVNITGRGGTFEAIDVALEHVNAMYHIDMKMRKNSTHDMDKTFRNVALASSYTTVLRAAVESAFGGHAKYCEGCKAGCVRPCYVAFGCWQCKAEIEGGDQARRAHVRGIRYTPHWPRRVRGKGSQFQYQR